MSYFSIVPFPFLPLSPFVSWCVSLSVLLIYSNPLFSFTISISLAPILLSLFLYRTLSLSLLFISRSLICLPFLTAAVFFCCLSHLFLTPFSCPAPGNEYLGVPKWQPVRKLDYFIATRSDKSSSPSIPSHNSNNKNNETSDNFKREKDLRNK